MAPYEFDIEHWIRLFSLAKIRATTPWKTAGQAITGPLHMAVTEQLRREAMRVVDAGPTVAVDAFIFARGEPESRDATKIGGVPYRPAQCDWPTASNGEPLTFVAQLNFVESRDLFRSLPGDILLVFCRDSQPLEDDPDAFRFEWHRVGGDELASASDCPAPGWDFLPCYGFRYRTADYPNACDCFKSYKEWWRLEVLESTKIGGCPPSIQPAPPLPGTFLGSIGSQEPDLGSTYPWINQEAPLNSPRTPVHLWKSEDALRWGDAGVVNLFLQNNGEVLWQLQSY